jgi:hypothetical protein
MSLTHPEKRAAIAALHGVKKQFEACAPRCQTISHFYLVRQLGEYLPSAVQGIIKRFGVHWSHTGTLQDHHEVFYEGGWVGWHFAVPPPPIVWECQLAGKESCIKRFDALSEDAGSLLASLRIVVPVPPEIRATARDCKIPEDLPLIPSEPQRWATFLHWLAWSGGPLGVERQSWDGALVFPYDRAQDLPRTFGLNVSGPLRFCYETPDHPYNHFYSIIDNLFVRSSAALQWIISPLNDRKHVADAGGSGQPLLLANAKDEVAAREFPDEKPTEALSWLTVTRAALIAHCNTGVISRAVDERKLKSNGKKKRERKIDSLDLNRWNLLRLARPGPSESTEHVQRLVDRHCQ